MKDFFTSLAAIVVTFYLTFSVFFFVKGIATANDIGVTNPRYRFKPRCLYSPSRIEIIFPAYKLGCYLGANPNVPYYNFTEEGTK